MKPKLRLDIAVRVVADAVMLGISLSAGVLLASVGRDADGLTIRTLIVRDSAFLIALALPVLYLVGVYTKSRTYQMRFKALCIFEASIPAFLSLGAIDSLFKAPHLSLKAGLIAYLMALSFLVGARIWSKLWIYVLVREHSVKPTLTQQELARNVLLIGGAGYIGSALLPRLLGAGYRVRLLDLFVYGKEPIAEYLNHPNLELIQADFRQVDSVVKAMQDIGTVIHLGAIVGDPACALNEDLTIEVNLIATRMIAEVAKGQGVSRFIFASTCSVYGASDQALDERSALNPISLYARSKIACEKVLLGLRGSSFHPVILRFGTVYGLSGRTRFDLVINVLAAKALIDGVITVYGSDQWRPFVHVADAARAVMLALDVPVDKLQPAIFNVGSDEQNRTLGQVGELVQRMVPSAELTCTDDDSIDRRNYRVSFARVRQALQFSPEWTIEAGITQVLEEIRNGNVTDYLDPRYSNVKFLSEEVGRNKLPVQNGWAKELVDGCEDIPVAIASD